jgi:hypothetical protein
MRLAFQIAVALAIGFGALYAGVLNYYSPALVLKMFFGISFADFDDATKLAVTTQARMLAGMWVAAGIMTFVSLRRFERHGNALRLVFLGLALGSVGELATAVSLGGSLTPAVLKAGLQIGIYLALELWRLRLSRAAGSPAGASV